MTATPNEIRRFCELSEWSVEWFDDFGQWCGINPHTHAPDDLRVITQRLRKAGQAFCDLGTCGAEFVFLFRAVQPELIRLTATSGEFVASLGYVNDFINSPHKNKFHGISETVAATAHGAAANWIDRMGELFFDGWQDAIEGGRGFGGRYFDSSETKCAAGKLLQHICWNGDARLAVRMRQERELLLNSIELTSWLNKRELKRLWGETGKSGNIIEMPDQTFRRRIAELGGETNPANKQQVRFPVAELLASGLVIPK